MMSQQWWAVGVVLFSFTLAVGWSWLKQKQGHSWQSIDEQWPGRTAQFFYFVGIPYLAVVAGIITTRLLGLKGLEYFVLIDLGRAPVQQIVAEIQYAVVLMLLEWVVDSSATIITGFMALLLLAGVRLGLSRSASGFTTSSKVSVLNVIYYGLHWAFYRAVFWLITADLYLGVILGTGLVILEWSLVIWVEKNWQSPQQLQLLLMNVIILLLTATVFFYSPNLWLLWPVHLAMVVLVNSRHHFVLVRD